jgi:hypothetical protein
MNDDGDPRVAATHLWVTGIRVTQILSYLRP